MKKAVALYFFCVLMTCYTAGAATMTISADKDTYIDKYYPDSATLDRNGICWSAALHYKAGQWATSF